MLRNPIIRTIVVQFMAILIAGLMFSVLDGSA